MAKTKTYSVHCVIGLLLISWPMIFAYLKYVKRQSSEDLSYNKPNLVGIVINDKKPELNAENWFSGIYQSESNDYDNDHWSLKEIMVRFKNK